MITGLTLASKQVLEKKIKESLDLKKRLHCNYVCFTQAKTESLDKSKTVRLGKVMSG